MLAIEHSEVEGGAHLPDDRRRDVGVDFLVGFRALGRGQDPQAVRRRDHDRVQQVGVDAVDLGRNVADVVGRPHVQQQADVPAGEGEVRHGHAGFGVRQRERVGEVHRDRAGPDTALAAEHRVYLAVSHRAGGPASQPFQRGG